MARKRVFSVFKFEYLFYLLIFIFSWNLMWGTFRINPQGNLEIATKVWSDFSATIPLIRSFSFGSNFPPQYPLFAGPPIRYHFIFFAIVGFLEKLGSPLDWAINSLSIVGFFILVLSIYLLAKHLFKRKIIGAISVILFLFNSSLGFIEYFKKNPISTESITKIAQNTQFSSFGPYDGKTVSAFWSLNIFTNQRHLAFAYAFFLLLILFIYKSSLSPKKLTWKKVLLLGIIVGLFPFFHLAVFGMMGIALVIFFLIYKKIRMKIFSAGILALILAIPQFLYMGASQTETQFLNLGYLVKELTIGNFFEYWLLNLGIIIFLFPIGFFLANSKQRKIFLPFLALFVVGNLFQFSVEIAANHKFFNLFIIGANMFSAYFLYKLWNKKIAGKATVIIIFPLLVLTGIIDYFPIVNDRFVTLKDIPNNKTAAFIYNKTPIDSTILNAQFLYDPASLAGRKIFLGWPYFSWSAGYDTHSRFADMQKILNTPDRNKLCTALKENSIDYIEIQNPTNLEDMQINYSFFDNNFDKIFFDEDTGIYVYDVGNTCKL